MACTCNHVDQVHKEYKGAMLCMVPGCPCAWDITPDYPTRADLGMPRDD